jgi:hypothetical protein
MQVHLPTRGNGGTDPVPALYMLTIGTTLDHAGTTAVLRSSDLAVALRQRRPDTEFALVVLLRSACCCRKQGIAVRGKIPG